MGGLGAPIRNSGLFFTFQFTDQRPLTHPVPHVPAQPSGQPAPGCTPYLLTTGPQVARPHAHELPLRRLPPRLLAPSRAPSATLRAGLATPQARVQLFAERFERRVALGCSFRLG